MSGPGDPPRASPAEDAEEVFLAHLERGETSAEEGGLEALCARHPALQAELRELAARWELAVRVRGSALAPVGDEPSAPLASLLARLTAKDTAQPRYRDEGEIARGAQGVVRRTFDETLQRHVAMKRLHEEGQPPGSDVRGSGSSRRLGRFLEEAQVTAQLEHPAIVPVHELGLDAHGVVYFTMKLVKGRSLHEVLSADGGPAAQGWTTTRLLGALVRVAEAMAFAHDRGVVHRDLKPSNVMLGEYGEVYVMDWGLARVLGTDANEGSPLSASGVAAPRASSAGAVRSERRVAADAAPGSSLLTLEGDVVGTPQYMAPEQAAGDLGQLGPAADVYALGAMLYHVLAGRAPYATAQPAAQRSSPVELLAAVRRGAPAALHSVAPGVPPELEAICEKAMARDLTQRYAGMGALAGDLRAFLESRVVKAYETGPLAELRKWVRRNRALAAAGAAVLVAVLGGLLYASRVERQGRERAEAAQAESDRNLAKVLRLSDVQRLDRLRREADTLWPADPPHVAALTAWLDEARALLGRAESHRATLDELRGRAEPYSAAEAQRDRDDPRLAEELAAEQASLATLRAMLAELDQQPADDPARRAVILRKTGERQAAIDRVQGLQAARRTWRFATEEDTWWHATLAGLLDGLARFRAVTLPSVETRLDRAQNLERISLIEPAAQWEQAIASIADPSRCPLYRGLRITPQLGLVPLGRNERTGLWEFWDVQLGERPAQAADGRYVLKPESGLLFVLLPGGDALFGSQSGDPAAPNSDRFDPKEAQLRTVRLEPFFISAYELTQAQWERAMARNPSLYYAPCESVGNVYTEANPVESIAWAEAAAMARGWGFTLPTEAQWEYACRGGTTTRWWTGADVASLAGAANIADRWLGEHMGAGWEFEPGLDDGHGAHAPVGSYRANGFGLYDTIGNVEEWVRDAFVELPKDFAPGDGEQLGGNAVQHPSRGGSYLALPPQCTSAHRSRVQSEMRSAELGMRAARRVAPGRD